MEVVFVVRSFVLSFVLAEITDRFRRTFQHIHRRNEAIKAFSRWGGIGVREMESASGANDEVRLGWTSFWMAGDGGPTDERMDSVDRRRRRRCRRWLGSFPKKGAACGFSSEAVFIVHYRGATMPIWEVISEKTSEVVGFRSSMTFPDNDTYVNLTRTLENYGNTKTNWNFFLKHRAQICPYRPFGISHACYL